MTLISLAARLRTFNWCVTSRHQLRSTRRCDHPIANREFEASRSFRLRSSYLAVHFGLNSVTQISVHQRILSYLVKNRISNPIFVYRSNGAVDNRSVIYSFHEKEKFAKRETRRERVFVTGSQTGIIRFSWSAPQKDSLRSLSSFEARRRGMGGQWWTAKRRNSGARKEEMLRCSGTTCSEETRDAIISPRTAGEWNAPLWNAEANICGRFWGG